MEDILDIEAVAEVDVEAENEVDVEVEVEQAGPAGLSAYEIYLKNGGKLTEVEWLASLKGENGETPVLGEDYWTNEDITAIEEHCNSYIDSQLGIINEQLASLTEVSE